MKRVASAIVLLSACSVSFGIQYRFHRMSEYAGPNLAVGGLSDDGQWILGTYSLGNVDQRSVAINRRTGQEIQVDSPGALVNVPSHRLSTGEILGRNLIWTGVVENRPYIFDPSTQQITQLPNPLNPENYIFRVQDVLNENEFIGQLWWERVGDIQYARWTRTNGVWTASMISTGPQIYVVAGYDQEGYIYGQYDRQPCRWDRELNRTILSTNSATPYGQVVGRLPDGRYAGRLYYSNFGVSSTSVVTWDNLTAAPVVQGNWNTGTFSAGPLSDNGSFVLNTSGASADPRIWDPIDGLQISPSSVVNMPSGVRLKSLKPPTKSGSIAALIDGGYAILDPVPEPATLVALGLGIAPLARRRRRR